MYDSPLGMLRRTCRSCGMDYVQSPENTSEGICLECLYERPDGSNHPDYPVTPMLSESSDL